MDFSKWGPRLKIHELSITGNHINKATQGDPQQFTRKKGPFPGKARPQNKAFTGNIVVLLPNKYSSLFY